MSSDKIRERLEKVGVDVNVNPEEITIENLRKEISDLRKYLDGTKDQLRQSKERESFLEHEISEAQASLAIERLAVRGLSGGSRHIYPGESENGLDSNVLRTMVSLYVSCRRRCRTFTKFTVFLIWIFIGFFVSIGINTIFNNIF
jgi:hypothetical protein